MNHLDFRENEPMLTERIDQLDENLVDKLSHRSKKNGLSDNSKATYRSIIRDYNKFLVDNGLHVSHHDFAQRKRNLGSA